MGPPHLVDLYLLKEITDSVFRFPANLMLVGINEVTLSDLIIKFVIILRETG